MKVMLLGPPGVGKGTQASRLQEKLNLDLLTMSGVLKDPQMPKDQMQIITSYINKGQLVPDDIVYGALLWAMQKKSDARGYILDGFPRNLNQVKWLKSQVDHIDVVLYFDAQISVLVERISGRLVEPQSGRSYHRLFAPPKKDGFDDINGLPLIRRKDDDPAVVEQRLAVYQSKIKPLLDWLEQEKTWVGRFCRIDASVSADGVWKKLLDIFS